MKLHEIKDATDSLNDLSLILALRKELEIDKEDAEAALAWLRDESGADLPDDAYNGMVELFDERIQKENVQHHDLEEFLQQWTWQMLKKKYKLDTGWPL